MVLIADSGSTKTAWCRLGADGCTQRLSTSGINPFYMTEEEIQNELKSLAEQLDGTIEKVYFYGAGVASAEKAQLLQSCFQKIFQHISIEACTDLLGAARALCGHDKGIACILGTGSNSCFYDGVAIADHVPPLGFILGDEGSGAALGKKLISDVLKRQLPKDLQEKFIDTFHLTQEIILENVYRKPFPNRFLASFTEFLHKQRNERYVQELLFESFDHFFVRNVMHYDYKNYPIHLLGSVAFYFQDIIKTTAQRRGMTIGNIAKGAIDGLLRYHIPIQDT